MKVIHKYPLKSDYQVTIVEEEVNLPEGAEVLTVQVQGSTPCIWALVDTDRKIETLSVAIIGTGHPFAADWLETPKKVYVGTYQLAAGTFVKHVFIEKKGQHSLQAGGSLGEQSLPLIDTASVLSPMPASTSHRKSR